MSTHDFHQLPYGTPFDEYREQSALHAYGYTVGVRSPLRSRRARILLSFFRADLGLRFEPGEYEEVGASEWGMPGSRERWQRMHSHLSWQRELLGARRLADAARHLDEDIDYVGRQLMVDFLEGSRITGVRRQRANRVRKRRSK